MKNLLAGTAIVAIAGVVAIGAPTKAQSQEFNLTFQSTWSAADPHHHNFERWAAEVEKNTNGRVTIETLPAGSVVPGRRCPWLAAPRFPGRSVPAANDRTET